LAVHIPVAAPAALRQVGLVPLVHSATLVQVAPMVLWLMSKPPPVVAPVVLPVVAPVVEPVVPLVVELPPHHDASAVAAAVHELQLAQAKVLPSPVM
jgi:hypothetical protein